MTRIAKADVTNCSTKDMGDLRRAPRFFLIDSAQIFLYNHINFVTPSFYLTQYRKYKQRAGP